MNVKLVNYKTHKGHDGMRGLNAEIVYNGKKIATVHDDAYGGEFEYHAIGSNSGERIENNKLLNELYELTKGYDGKYSNLDSLVCELATELDRKKDEQKGVLVKTNYGYDTQGFNVSIPTLIKKYSDGLEALQGVYDEVKAAGKEILNTAYLEKVGVKL